MSAVQFQVSRHHHHPRRAGFIMEGLLAATERAVDTVKLWQRRARERDQLARMDDRILSDIGISRSEAAILSDKPFWKE